MTLSPMSRRAGALAALLFVSLLSCGREVTGPEGGARAGGSIGFAPYLEMAGPFEGEEALNVGSLVPFVKVRILITRAGVVIVDKIVNFPSGKDSVALQVLVPLKSASSAGETVQASLRYITATGDTVFRGGPLDVLVRPGATANPTPIQMALQYTGPGSQAVTIDITPDSIVGTMGQTVAFTTTARDAANAVVANAVRGFISRAPAIAAVPALGSGNVQLVGARGTAWIVAQLINGAVDSAYVRIDPRPTTLAIESGNGQATLQGTPFAQPLRVRVRAADNIGVAGWPVNFVVSSGQGTLDSLVAHTNASGIAQVLWTAGDSAGMATVTASIPTPALNVVFTGTQLSSAASSITFESQPTNITAGQSLPNISVAVRDGANTVLTTYTGPVTLTTSGGTAGAKLVGDTVQNAVAGVATFTGLTVDRGGSNYRLVATGGGAPPGQSNTFNVAAAPAANIALLGGDGQSAPAGGTLTDSIRVRVTDSFGFPVPAVQVTFAVTQGGGSITPVTGNTDADGRFATAWTVGTAGPQQLTASVGALTPIVVTATAVAGGGPSVLFAGYDYTYIPAGQTRNIPIFLSAPSASPITVTLASGDTTVAKWDVDSVVIAAGQTSVGVPMSGREPGNIWAFLNSSAGNDSVFVYVDSAFVDFGSLQYTTFTVGDTVLTIVRLSDPAPAGGVTVTVRSLDPSLALVAPTRGEQAPIPACIGTYCGGGLRADGPLPATSAGAQLLAPPADSALIFIPEGELVGQVAVLVLAWGEGPGTYAYFSAEAPGYAGNQTTLFIDEILLNVTALNGTPSEALGVGQKHVGYVYLNGAWGARDRRITFLSRNEPVAVVDTLVVATRLEYQSGYFEIRALSVGTAWIVYASPGVAADSFLVTVNPPRLQVFPNLSSVPIGGTEALYVYTSPTGGSPQRRTDPLSVTLRATNPAVLEFPRTTGEIARGEDQRQMLFRVIGAGSSYLVAEAPGHQSDSVLISSTNASAYTDATVRSMGVGQYQLIGVQVPYQLVQGRVQQVDVTSLDPGTLRVLTPTVYLSEGGFVTEVAIEGLAVGPGSIELTGQGLTASQVSFTVTPPKLILGGANLQVSPDSVEREMVGFTSDGTYARPPMDSVFAVLRSSDPSVVEITDSVMVVGGGSEMSTLGRFRPILGGSAQLTLHAPGYDSSNVITVTVAPYQLLVSVADTTIGRGVREYASLYRSSPTTAPLMVTVTQSGPGAVTFTPSADSIPAGSAQFFPQVGGVSLGADTVVFSAPGHLPDTLFLNVVETRIELDPNSFEVPGAYVDPVFAPYLRAGVSSLPRRADVETKFVIRSLDTTRARVVQDTVVFLPDEAYPSMYATVQYLESGTVSLVAEDVAGLIAPDTLAVLVYSRELYGFTSTSENSISLGMGQRTYADEVLVTRLYAADNPFWVHLKPSRPGLITIPDSVLIAAGEAYAEIPIVAGDTVGAVRVEASAPGFTPWLLDVVVTRTVAGVYIEDTFVGGRGVADVYLMDAFELLTRPMASSVPLQFVSERPEVADASASAFVFPADQDYFSTLGPLGVSVGTATIALEDTRSALFALVTRGTTEMYVEDPRITLHADHYLIGRDLTSLQYSQGFSVDQARDSIWVRLASVGGRFTISTDSILVERFTSVEEPDLQSSTMYDAFELTGVTAGVDTLVLSADGIRSDTAIVTITGALLQLANRPSPTILVGDSTLVQLAFADGSGQYAMTAAAMSLSFSTDTTLAVSDGTSVVGVLNIPVGATGASFWVKGSSPGTSELLVTGSGFLPLRLTFTVRVIPE